MTRKISALILLLCLMIMSVSCGGGKSTKMNEAPESEAAATSTIDLSIEGMTCTGCENTICTSLEKIQGVESVTASYTDGKATIKFDPGKVDTATLKAAVDATGYKALKVMNVSNK